MSTDQFDTVVIGGGQAGLAMGYYLSLQHRNFVILDAAQRVGDVWRSRWDSLRLFTPAKFSGLPGRPFPGKDFDFPTKDQVAEYLERYAEEFALPVRPGTRVESLSLEGDRFALACGTLKLTTERVVVATGAYPHPYIPSWASSLGSRIVQLHSSAYRNPAQLPAGDVLVVGAGNSGAEIAIELAGSGRTTWLSGRDTGRIPADKLGRLFGGRMYWWMISHLLSESTPMGRKVKARALQHGTPLIGVRSNDILRAGVVRVPRVTGTRDSRPSLEDGRTLDVSSVVWSTGFRSDFGWIRLPVLDDRGHPVHDRGVARKIPGLYFLGLPFQYSLSSSLLGGAGADARYLAERIQAAVEAAAGTA